LKQKKTKHKNTNTNTNIYFKKTNQTIIAPTATNVSVVSDMRGIPGNLVCSDWLVVRVNRNAAYVICTNEYLVIWDFSNP